MKTKASNESESPAKRWIFYRPEIQTLDCTVRNGDLWLDNEKD